MKFSKNHWPPLVKECIEALVTSDFWELDCTQEAIASHSILQQAAFYLAAGEEHLQANKFQKAVDCQKSAADFLKREELPGSDKKKLELALTTQARFIEAKSRYYLFNQVLSSQEALLNVRPYLLPADEDLFTVYCDWLKEIGHMLDQLWSLGETQRVIDFYGYDFTLMSNEAIIQKELEQAVFYVAVQQTGVLYYRVIDPSGKLQEGNISIEEQTPLLKEALESKGLDFGKLKRALPEILEITSRKGHTYPYSQYQVLIKQFFALLAHALLDAAEVSEQNYVDVVAKVHPILMQWWRHQQYENGKYLCHLIQVKSRQIKAYDDEAYSAYEDQLADKIACPESNLGKFCAGPLHSTSNIDLYSTIQSIVRLLGPAPCTFSIVTSLESETIAVSSMQKKLFIHVSEADQGQHALYFDSLFELLTVRLSMLAGDALFSKMCRVSDTNSTDTENMVVLYSVSETLLLALKETPFSFVPEALPEKETMIKLLPRLHAEFTRLYANGTKIAYEWQHFLGLPQQKTLSSMMIYLLGGFILYPVLNVIKLFTEYLPAVFSILALCAKDTLERKNMRSTPSKMMLTGTVFLLLGAAYFFQALTFVGRALTSPIFQFKETKGILRVLAIVITLIGYSVPAFFLSPLLIPVLIGVFGIKSAVLFTSGLVALLVGQTVVSHVNKGNKQSIAHPHQRIFSNFGNADGRNSLTGSASIKLTP